MAPKSGEMNFFSKFFSQMYIMMKKNAILQRRYWRSTLVQTVLSPLVFVLLLFLLQSASYAKQEKQILVPASYPLEPVLRCQGAVPTSTLCISIMYASNNETESDVVMQNFAAANTIRNSNSSAWVVESTVFDQTSALQSGKDIVRVPSASFIYDYTLNNPNTTLFGVVFNYDVNGNLSTVSYQVWFNYTLVANGTDVYSRQILALFRGIDEALLTRQNGVTAEMDITFKDWPLIPALTLSDNIVQSLGSGFFFASTMVIFINLLSSVVTEKELKLRQSMQMMGLMPCVYWWTMIPCGMFITTFMRRARVAVLFGVFVVVIGFLFETFVFSSTYVGYIWWDSNTDQKIWKSFVVLIPFFNFGKVYVDINTLTTGQRDVLTDSFTPGPGFPWSALYQQFNSTYLPNYNTRVPDVPAPFESFNWMIFNIFFYGVLTWYFDAVIPDEFGQYLPFYFFLLPEYWGFKSKNNRDTTDPSGKDHKFKDEEEDVAKERQLVYQNCRNKDSPSAAIRIVNLLKVYQNSLFRSSKLDKIAVNRLCLELPEGKLLALLGQNGAGKTTTMNVLSGLTPASDGDAWIYGHSVKYEMDKIRQDLGICPQHDILYEDLTSYEHIELYGGLKGLKASELTQVAKERLDSVRLTKVADKTAGTYSGGMKRRLSMIISTIGDPRVLFMDEPTTGMDPVNRRHVWRFIEQFKKGRCIILTSHSMEECDTLGDRIAIMAHGRLRALNKSINLKNKFGAGYRISLNTQVSQVEQVKQVVAQRVPQAVLEDDSAGALIFQFPMAATASIPGFVKYLESEALQSKLIQAWGISQTTLEEVFLTLIRKANPKGYQGYEVASS